MNEELELDMRWAHCGHIRQGGWSIAWAQLIGVRHPRLSEDCVGHQITAMPPLGYAVSLAVADGVGGGARGDLASSALTGYCTRAPCNLILDAEGMKDWMRDADFEVQLKLRDVTQSPGAATLAAAWLMPDGSGQLMRVGDSRAYQFGSRGLEALDVPHLVSMTIDQTYAYLQAPHPEGTDPDDPARMIGTGAMGEPEIDPLMLMEGHTLLLCTDGLHRGIDEFQIGRVLAENDQMSMTAMQLAATARARGSEDDISVLLVSRMPRGIGAAVFETKNFSGSPQWL